MFFRPRTRPKTSLQCFALEQRESKAKHCRDVLGQGKKLVFKSSLSSRDSSTPEYIIEAFGLYVDSTKLHRFLI